MFVSRKPILTLSRTINDTVIFTIKSTQQRHTYQYHLASALASANKASLQSRSENLICIHDLGKDEQTEQLIFYIYPFLLASVVRREKRASTKSLSLVSERRVCMVPANFIMVDQIRCTASIGVIERTTLYEQGGNI